MGPEAEERPSRQVALLERAAERRVRASESLEDLTLRGDFCRERRVTLWRSWQSWRDPLWVSTIGVVRRIEESLVASVMAVSRDWRRKVRRVKGVMVIVGRREGVKVFMHVFGYGVVLHVVWIVAMSFCCCCSCCCCCCCWLLGFVVVVVEEEEEEENKVSRSSSSNGK